MKVLRSVFVAAVAFALPESSLLAQEAPREMHPTPPPALDGSLPPPIQPAAGPRVVRPAPPIPVRTPTGQLGNDIVAWDAQQKEDVVKAGEAEAHFKFNLTNVSPDTVTIHSVATSCGCTTAHLPPMPWKLAPDEHGEINVTMNLAGKMGTVYKTITVSTDKGNKLLLVKTTILPAAAANNPMGARELNQKIALADRQAVFKGDCARCHAAPAKGKMGGELYTAVCGVCHESEHRATMVPDLHNIKQETGREFWTVWITYGKTGSLMPAFSKLQGGPLTDEQIRSLAAFLTTNIPSKVTAQ